MLKRRIAKSTCNPWSAEPLLGRRKNPSQKCREAPTILADEDKGQTVGASPGAPNPDCEGDRYAAMKAMLAKAASIEDGAANLAKISNPKFNR